MADTHNDRIKVRCPGCGAKLGLPAGAVGRRAKCPKCEHKFTVEAPTAKPAPKQPDPLAFDDGDGASSLMESLAAEARTASTAAPPTPRGHQTPCPHCGTLMPADARLCVSCGYDVKSGRSLKAARAGPGKAAIKARSAALSAGGFMLGTGLSAVGAMIGAGIWCGVAVGTNCEIGWIAIGLGALAGFGMRLGYGKENFKAGAVAAILAVAGIAAAKIMIVTLVLWPIVSQVVNFKSPARNLMHSLVLTNMVAELLGDAYYDGDEYAEEDGQSEDLKEARARAAEIFDSLSDQQLRDRYVRYNRYSSDFPVATANEREFQKNWVAAALADRRGDLEGVPWDDYERWSFYEDEKERMDGLSEAELDAAIHEYLAWEENGRWEDKAYVQAALIAERIRQYEDRKAGWSLEQRIQDVRMLPPRELFDKIMSADEGRELLPEEWRELHVMVRDEVRALSPKERVAQARELILDRESNEEELARALEGLPSLESLVVTAGAPEFMDFALRQTVGAFDILFVLLAVGAAYKIASGEGKSA